MKSNFEYIGSNIRKTRKAKSLTIAALAELIGVSDSYLALCERGQSGLSVDSIIKIASVLNVTTDSLLLDNQPTPKPSTELETTITMLTSLTKDELNFINQFITLCKRNSLFT